jgi:hypothetical protein
MPYPNATAANWPVTDMTKHGNEWSFTTPLPSGIFSYGFYVNCASATGAGCTEVSDPANPPWNVTGTSVKGSTEPVSQVYVPSDPKFGAQDLSWEAPNPRHGSLTDITYPAPTSQTPAGQNYLSVYTPPGYDPNRAQPYPTLYALAPDDEVAWTTQGDLANILDNLIDDGEIQPMVLVSANLNGFPASSDSSVFDANLTIHPTRRRFAVGGSGGGTEECLRLRRRRLPRPLPLVPRLGSLAPDQPGRFSSPGLRQQRPRLVLMADQREGLPHPGGVLPAPGRMTSPGRCPLAAAFH